MLTRITYSARRALAEMGRNVFELYLMLLAALAGLQGVLRPDPITPEPVEPILPPWGRIVWYGGLLLGAVIVTVGIALAPPLGSMIEQSGLVVLIGSGLSYAVLMLGAQALDQALIVATFVFVLGVRMYYLRWEPRAVAAAVRLIRSPEDGEQ